MTLMWYFSSVICMSTTKTLQNGPLNVSPMLLCLLQLATCVPCGLAVTALKAPEHFKRRREIKGMTKYTVFSGTLLMIGFNLLNWSLKQMMPSVVMVMRAMEPAFAFALAWATAFEKVTWQQGLTLVPVIAGACIMMAETPHFTWVYLALLCIQNLIFVGQAQITKRIRRKFGVKSVPLFTEIFGLGALVQALFHLVVAPLLGLSSVPAIPFAMPSAALGGKLLYNAVSFFAYMNLSFAVLSQVTVLTHSMLNSMRRVVVVFGTALFFGQVLGLRELFGVALSCGGAMAYGYISGRKARAALAAK